MFRLNQIHEHLPSSKPAQLGRHLPGAELQEHVCGSIPMSPSSPELGARQMLSGADTELGTGWMLQGWRQHRGRREETVLGNQRTDQEKAMVGTRLTSILPSPRCKAISGGGDAKGQLRSIWGAGRGREQLKIKAPSPGLRNHCPLAAPHTMRPWEMFPPFTPVPAHPVGMGQHISPALGLGPVD